MLIYQKMLWTTALLCAFLVGLTSGMPPDKGMGPKPKVAVVFSDIKFDDKAAIWSLMRDPQYSRVLVVTSGIDSHYRATSSLMQFVMRQNALPVAELRMDTSKLLILHGHNPLNIPAPHEIWFTGLPQLRRDDLSDTTLKAILRGNRVAIFQIAPTSLADVAAVLRNADLRSVKSLMLLHGYNSRQADMVEQESFITSLRPLLLASNPQAEVYFTSSFASYPAKDGGKHPIEWVRSLFPADEIEQALKDPFWSEQLRRGEQFIANPAVLDLLPLDNVAELDKMILAARLDPTHHEAERQRIVAYVNAVLDAIKPGHLDERLEGRLQNTFLPEFTGRTTIELADAGHIAAFHRYMAKEQRPVVASIGVRYPSGVTDPRANPAFETEFASLSPHGRLLIGARTDLDRLWMEGLANFHTLPR